MKNPTKLQKLQGERAVRRKNEAEISEEQAERVLADRHKFAASTAVNRRKDGSPRKTTAAIYPNRERVAEVEMLKALMFSNSEIRRRIVAKYGVTARTVTSDLARVNAEILEFAKATQEVRYSDALHTARSLMRKSLSVGDYKAAERFFDKVCKLQGTYATPTIKHDVKLGSGVLVIPIASPQLESGDDDK